MSNDVTLSSGGGLGKTEVSNLFNSEAAEFGVISPLA